MIMQVFTVFDAAVGAYLQPFFCRSKGEATRSFGEACNDKSKPFFNHPLDFTLVYLGEWDDGGAVFNCAPPVRIVSAHECVVDGGSQREFVEQFRGEPSRVDARSFNGPGGHSV